MNQHKLGRGMAKRLQKMQKGELGHCGTRLITISRHKRGAWLGAGFAWILMLSLAGCAAPAPHIASSGGEAATARGVQATILAIRPVPPAAPQGSTAILTAMGAPAGQTTGESEIILRTDDGAILSVVQAESSGLAPGARVVVLTSPNLHLARPGYTTPTS
jgi:outer membrane lipoprotein SlyB